MEPSTRLTFLESIAPQDQFNEHGWITFQAAVRGWRACQEDWAQTMRDLMSGHIYRITRVVNGSTNHYFGVILPADGV